MMQGTSTVFTKRVQGHRVVIISYVDDLIMFSESPGAIAEVTAVMKRCFDIGEEQGLDEYLRIRFETHDWGVELSQAEQIEATAERYGAARMKRPSGPTSPAYKPWQGTGDKLGDAQLTRYRSIVGSCLYYAVKTRDDCLYAATTLARYFVGATNTHLKAALRLLAYLYHTRRKTCKLWFNGPNDKLTVYTDASFISDLDDCRSVHGYRIYYGKTLVHYGSRKIRVICTSTSEAEYIGMAHAVRQGFWLEEILGDLRPTQPFDVLTDSTVALKWTNDEETKQSRYIATRYHVTRQAALAGRIQVHYTPTNTQLADDLTKPKLPDTSKTDAGEG